MIRTAIIKDVPNIVRMMREFHSEAKQLQEFDDISAYNFMANMIHENHIVYVSKGGFICGFVTPSPINSEWKIAMELFLWAKDGKGVQLMNAFTEAAERRGASEVRFSCRANTPKFENHLQRVGYTHDEQVYTRVI